MVTARVVAGDVRYQHTPDDNIPSQKYRGNGTSRYFSDTGISRFLSCRCSSPGKHLKACVCACVRLKGSNYAGGAGTAGERRAGQATD